MSGASKLLRKILAGRLPPRALAYSALNTLNRWRGTHNTRFEWERRYLENPDPWDFRGSAYEQRKYARILTRILEWRRASGRALELGCSIGIFSKRLAPEFAAIVAADFSGEALRRAVEHCRENRNVSFLRCDLRDFDCAGTFDVIVCAEVLYYLEQDQAPAGCRQLQRYLGPGGIVVLVEGIADSSGFWPDTLAGEFQPLFSEAVPDEVRPYQIAIFQSRPGANPTAT
jgi:2-polyprenyl-3-methyl-5-hydroxy-6-metoxy-1,4-benzoquinol methylase